MMIINSRPTTPIQPLAVCTFRRFIDALKADGVEYVSVAELERAIEKAEQS